MQMTETFDMPTLLSELNRDEGRRLKPYLDTVGKTTIGVGRNLTDVGISDVECNLLLENDVMRSIMWLDRHLPWWRSLDAVRQRVIINMAFNMGRKLLTFANTLAAMQRGDYEAAANGMLASKWATQVGARAYRLATMMRTGAI
jgi:lysozyme